MSSVNALKNRTHSTSPRNLHKRALSGGSIHQVRHIKVASGRGSFMRVLYTILGTRRLTYELLNTNFCPVEHAINARPLTPVIADPSNVGAITPNHFLFGNQTVGTPSIVDFDEVDHRKRYACAQFYANAIGARWPKECVPTLNRISKWQTPAEPHLKVADLVWFVEESNL